MSKELEQLRYCSARYDEMSHGRGLSVSSRQGLLGGYRHQGRWGSGEDYYERLEILREKNRLQHKLWKERATGGALRARRESGSTEGTAESSPGKAPLPRPATARSYQPSASMSPPQKGVPSTGFGGARGSSSARAVASPRLQVMVPRKGGSAGSHRSAAAEVGWATVAPRLPAAVSETPNPPGNLNFNLNRGRASTGPNRKKSYQEELAALKLCFGSLQPEVPEAAQTEEPEAGEMSRQAAVERRKELVGELYRRVQSNKRLSAFSARMFKGVVNAVPAPGEIYRDVFGEGTSGSSDADEEARESSLLRSSLPLALEAREDMVDEDRRAARREIAECLHRGIMLSPGYRPGPMGVSRDEWPGLDVGVQAVCLPPRRSPRAAQQRHLARPHHQVMQLGKRWSAHGDPRFDPVSVRY